MVVVTAYTQPRLLRRSGAGNVARSDGSSTRKGRRAMTSGVIRPEHDFTVDRDGWELAIFNNANHFTVFTPGEGVGKVDSSTKVEVRTFPQALMEAQQDPRALVYAVTEAGRSVCLDHLQWSVLLTLWATRMLVVATKAIKAGWEGRTGDLTPEGAVKVSAAMAAKALKKLGNSDAEIEPIARAAARAFLYPKPVIPRYKEKARG